MNVSEANRLNVLLHWLFETEAADGRVPTHEQGMQAAAYLADRANASVHAGWDRRKVCANWHWADSGGDDDPGPASETGVAVLEHPAVIVTCARNCGARVPVVAPNLAEAREILTQYGWTVVFDETDLSMADLCPLHNTVDATP